MLCICWYCWDLPRGIDLCVLVERNQKVRLVGRWIPLKARAVDLSGDGQPIASQAADIEAYGDAIWTAVAKWPTLVEIAEHNRPGDLTIARSLCKVQGTGTGYIQLRQVGGLPIVGHLVVHSQGLLAAQYEARAVRYEFISV